MSLRVSEANAAISKSELGIASAATPPRNDNNLFLFLFRCSLCSSLLSLLFAIATNQRTQAEEN
jgi:hypothetical protein